MDCAQYHAIRDAEFKEQAVEQQPHSVPRRRLKWKGGGDRDRDPQPFRLHLRVDDFRRRRVGQLDFFPLEPGWVSLSLARRQQLSGASETVRRDYLLSDASISRRRIALMRD